MASVSYTRMADMTEADLRLIDADAERDARDLPARLMNAVAELERFQGPLKVSRLEHSLQSATRAHRAGKDKEYVAAALLHDIGDALAPHSHGDARDKYIDHPFYDDCVEFCEDFDQNCFDPDYDSLPLEFFRPLVEEVFRHPRHAADDLPFVAP